MCELTLKSLLNFRDCAFMILISASLSRGRGLRNYFPSIDALVDDASMMIQKVRAEFPQKRVFAVGESFGCMVLVTQILKEQQQGQGSGGNGNLADGYVLTGPVIKILRKSTQSFQKHSCGMMESKFSLTQKLDCFLTSCRRNSRNAST